MAGRRLIGSRRWLLVAVPLVVLLAAVPANSGAVSASCAETLTFEQEAGQRGVSMFTGRAVREVDNGWGVVFEVDRWFTGANPARLRRVRRHHHSPGRTADGRGHRRDLCHDHRGRRDRSRCGTSPCSCLRSVLVRRVLPTAATAHRCAASEPFPWRATKARTTGAGDRDLRPRSGCVGPPDDRHGHRHDEGGTADAIVGAVRRPRGGPGHRAPPFWAVAPRAGT